jgi:SpoVK/Ycf46/Vps4 family AAA+-type ATPase
MSTVTLPEIQQWLFRIGADEKLSVDLLNDPLLFNAYYAAMGNVVAWHDDAVAPKEHQRKSRESTEEMLKLIAALNAKTSVRVSSEYVSLFQAGAEAFDFYQGQEESFRNIIAQSKGLFDTICEAQSLTASIAETLDDLGDLANFSELDKQLVTMAFALRASTSFMVFMELAFEDKQRARAILPVMLGCEPTVLKAAMNEDGALAKSGLLPAAARGRKLLPLSEFWTDFLAGDQDGETNIHVRLLKPFEVRESTGAVGRLQSEDQQIIKSLIHADIEDAPATNVLLYGPMNVNKKGVVKKLLDDSGVNGWVLNAKEATDGDLGSLCFFAQRALAEVAPDDILIVEKAPSVLSGRKMTQFLFFRFESEDDEELKSADEVLLMENPVRTLWLSTAAARLSEESLGCFLFHSEIKRASRAERRQKVEEVIRSLGFSDKLEQELSLQAGLSEQQLKNAVTVAAIAAKDDSIKAESVILQTVSRSQQALDRREKDDLRIPVTQYSLEYLNTSGRFGAQQIISSLKKRQAGTLAFYGIPGTGKSQLAEYMAGELDKPLLTRRASELLDKYVGESEKRIAEMFAEGESEEAVVLLDEADTFLRDRTQANHQWEVSVVNELLQRMERFKGIFIIATNLFSQLDTAALRRFTFKLEFKELTSEQRWKMFLHESGLDKKQGEFNPEELEGIKKELASIEMLTPGDFATIKRQCLLLDEELSVDDWLDQLRLEAEMKQKATAERKLGFT